MTTTRNNIPELTHLQFAVLNPIGIAEITGHYIRESLKQSGINKSGPEFCQLMARLEKKKLVEGRYVQKIVKGQIIKERKYRMTIKGFDAVTSVKVFYRDKIQQLASNSKRVTAADH